MHLDTYQALVQLDAPTAPARYANSFVAQNKPRHCLARPKSGVDIESSVPTEPFAAHTKVPQKSGRGSYPRDV